MTFPLPPFRLRLRILLRLALPAAAWLLLAACAPAGPEGLRPRTYAYQVPAGATFDLAEGRALSRERMAARLRSVRLLFLGEHHTSPESHRFQRDMLELLVAQGRQVTVALEMFPPAADPALERWRQGELDELGFLEASDWYHHWGFPWAFYRDVFETIRRHHLPVHGVNVTREERRTASHQGLEALPAPLRAELGAGPPSPEPAALYLFDALGEAGHDGVGDPHSPRFQAFRRVQWLWERAMGVRAARLAEATGPEGIVVVLIGSGHLAFKLGANLQAARESALPQLTVWDEMVPHHSPPEAFRVPVGMADWVRVHEQQPGQPDYPSLIELKLERHERGVRVAAMRARHGSSLRKLREGDVILSLNGKPAADPTALRLAYERLPADGTATLDVLRGTETVTLSLPLHPPSPH